ncbi:hypothetical protein BO71DRAFT_207823 [Aspergillus ellipticus CBS 707.79]|uniref:Uncharacterized protein n=1 Tax=Aspergillus ellipticus CBS 707.79 TaxID=1448320 RepID=A0A319DD78_9EURO|nr:hypothetical protein BO71DRAFT_207823 [Aspergillus ellipticus CBS 707.79]
MTPPEGGGSTRIRCSAASWSQGGTQPWRSAYPPPKNPRYWFVTVVLSVGDRGQEYFLLQPRPVRGGELQITRSRARGQTPSPFFFFDCSKGLFSRRIINEALREEEGEREEGKGENEPCAHVALSVVYLPSSCNISGPRAVSTSPARCRKAASSFH